jgi:hypothetical protein
VKLTTDATNRRYMDFDPKAGYPAGESIYFECGRCGNILCSLPSDSVVCSCGNVAIDVDYGRVSVKEHSQFKVFEATK